MNNIPLALHDNISIRTLIQGVNLTLILNKNMNSVSTIFDCDGMTVKRLEIDDPIIQDNFKISNYEGPKITVENEYSGYCENAIPILSETIILSIFKISADSNKKILNQCDVHVFKLKDSDKIICSISRMFSSKYFPRRDSRSYFFEISKVDEDDFEIQIEFLNLEGDAFIENPLN